MFLGSLSLSLSLPTPLFFWEVCAARFDDYNNNSNNKQQQKKKKVKKKKQGFGLCALGP
jgi:hypothetical protein